jgi:hypothetical protein
MKHGVSEGGFAAIVRQEQHRSLYQFTASTTYTVLIIQILKTHLRRSPVRVYHLHGAQNASVKN